MSCEAVCTIVSAYYKYGNTAIHKEEQQSRVKLLNRDARK